MMYFKNCSGKMTCIESSESEVKAAMQPIGILLIEDDADIRDSVRILLESEGYSVKETANGADGLRYLDDTVSLVILDVMLPGISGIKTCEEIRKRSYVPVLFLTAKSSESDKLIGLTVGGDDYLIKPFSYSELLGRVRALLRRYHVYSGKTVQPEPTDPVIRIGGIELRQDRNEVSANGKEIMLTDLEYRIILLLMQHPRETFSAQVIYETVWQEPYYYASNGTVMVHIRKLRIKLEKNPDTPEHIKTIWGKGYRFE